MSRCFPFPPPGYERKTKADNSDLLKKEKNKEKKHKKEKRDKEKKEGTEKREKEKSDEKHREKKDKKDKHRDKKKHKKDRDRDKHQGDSFLPDEKRIIGPPEAAHVHKPVEKSKNGGNERSISLAEKRVAGLSAFQNGDQVSKSNHLALETEGVKYAPESFRRSLNEEKRTINQLPSKNVAAERKKDGGAVKMVGKSAGPLADMKERIKEKPAFDGRTGGRGVIVESKSSGNELVRNSVGMVQKGVGKTAGDMEEKTDQRVEVKEKIKEREVDDRKGGKRSEREKTVHKDKEREKEKKKKKKKEEKVKTKDVRENHLLKISVEDGNKKDFAVAQRVGLQNVPRDSYHGAPVHSSLGKRKEIGLNGIYNEHNTGPNKVAKTMGSTHLLTENGRSLEPCQNSAAVAPVTKPPPVNAKVDRVFAPDDARTPSTGIKVDGKERKKNGVIVPLPPASSQATSRAERKPDLPAKPSHPDTKYLGQVFSVPKMDEWSDFDDHTWLLDSNGSRTRNPDVESSGLDEAPQVWAKGLWLEPVDVYALPYVIPH